jgi:hypothetical protein
VEGKGAEAFWKGAACSALEPMKRERKRRERGERHRDHR